MPLRLEAKKKNNIFLCCIVLPRVNSGSCGSWVELSYRRSPILGASRNATARTWNRWNHFDKHATSNGNHERSWFLMKWLEKPMKKVKPSCNSRDFYWYHWFPGHFLACSRLRRLCWFACRSHDVGQDIVQELATATPQKPKNWQKVRKNVQNIVQKIRKKCTK